MTNCANNKRYGSDLDYLDDEQFEELLVHAAACVPCDELLRKYENDLIPMLQLTLDKDPSRTVNKKCSRRSRFSKVWVALVGNVSDWMKLALQSIWQTARKQPVHASGVTLLLFITMYAIVGYSKSYIQSLSLIDYLLLAEAVTVDSAAPSDDQTAKWLEDLTDNTPAIKVQETPATTPSSVKSKSRNGSRVSVIVNNMAYQGGDEKTNQDVADNSNRRSDEVIYRANPNYAFVRIQLVANPEEFKYITCTLIEKFGKPSVDRVILYPSGGICAWELPLLKRYELVIENSNTGFRETRSVFTQDNDVQRIEVTFDGKTPSQ